MPTRRALVVGAGIAGLSTALRLRRSDWEVVLVERASRFRERGYPSAFHGIGHNAAARLGLMPAFIARSQPQSDTVMIDAAGTPFAVRRKRSTDVPVLCRTDVVDVLRHSIGDVDVRRSTSAMSLVEDDCGVTVTFTDGGEDWFDLVVAADGADSAVRGAIFGERYLHRQDFGMVSSRLEMTSADAVCLALARRSVRLHPLSDGSSAVLFTWRGDAFRPLREVFGDLAWLVPGLLSQVDEESADRRAGLRVNVDRWALGQIALIGDAAWSAGGYCDRGASLAIGGAELLGDALDIFNDTAEALAWWEEQMRPVVRHVRRQDIALRGRWSSGAPPAAAVVRGTAKHTR